MRSSVCKGPEFSKGRRRMRIRPHRGNELKLAALPQQGKTLANLGPHTGRISNLWNRVPANSRSPFNDFGKQHRSEQMRAPTLFRTPERFSGQAAWFIRELVVRGIEGGL